MHFEGTNEWICIFFFLIVLIGCLHISQLFASLLFLTGVKENEGICEWFLFLPPVIDY